MAICERRPEGLRYIRAYRATTTPSAQGVLRVRSSDFGQGGNGANARHGIGVVELHLNQLRRRIPRPMTARHLFQIGSVAGSLLVGEAIQPLCSQDGHDLGAQRYDGIELAAQTLLAGGEALDGSYRAGRRLVEP